jgi:dipeptidase E
MKVVFIPTAGDLYKDTPWIAEDRKKLLSLGFTVEKVDIKNKTPEELKKLLYDRDIIFVAGGNTSYLLEKAQESGFMEVVKEFVKTGNIYIGSSAGSLLASPNIEVDKIYDEEFGKELASYEGLGLVPFVILPHADNPKYTPYLEKVFKEYGNKYELRKLNDNQAIIVRGDKTQTIEA